MRSLARVCARAAHPTALKTQKFVGSKPSRAAAHGSSFPASDRLRALLLGASPREVLARIVTDDPLRLRPAVIERLRLRCQLLDAGRVHLRSLALCAREACRYRGHPALAEWLVERVDEAVEQVLDEASGEDLREGVWAPLAEPLGLDPIDAHEACRIFNGLPLGERRAFFRLVIEREEPRLVAEELGVELAVLLQSARRALERLVCAHDSTALGGA